MPVKNYAQNKSGTSVVTLGAGTSMVGLIFKAFQNSINSLPQSSVELKSTPALLATYDYALADKFSLGVAFSYQSFSAQINGYEYINSMGDTISNASFKNTTTRINYAIRPLFHMGSSEDMDVYMGARIGFTKWNTKTDNLDPYYDPAADWDFLTNRVRTQVLFGLRYFFSDYIGVNGEIAIGTPYYMMAGLNFKF